MTIAEATVRLSIPAQGMSLDELETRIGQVVKQAPNDLLRQACQHMDAGLVENEPDVRAVKKRPLHLLTRFGWTRLVRWQVQDAQGRYRCPLDQVLGLVAGQHTSPWITDRAVGLATRLPFRQAPAFPGPSSTKRSTTAVTTAGPRSMLKIPTLKEMNRHMRGCGLRPHPHICLLLSLRWPFSAAC